MPEADSSSSYRAAPPGAALISFKNKKIHFGLHIRTHSWAPECKTDDDAERQLLHTPLAHCASRHRFYCIDLLSLELRGRNIFPPLFSNGPAHQSQAGPSCDGVGKTTKTELCYKLWGGNAHGHESRWFNLKFPIGGPSPNNRNTSSSSTAGDLTVVLTPRVCDPSHSLRQDGTELDQNCADKEGSCILLLSICATRELLGSEG